MEERKMIGERESERNNQQIRERELRERDERREEGKGGSLLDHIPRGRRGLCPNF